MIDFIISHKELFLFILLFIIGYATLNFANYSD